MKTQQETKAITLTARHILYFCLGLQTFFALFSFVSHYFLLGEWDLGIIWDYIEMTWFMNVMMVIILLEEDKKDKKTQMTEQARKED